MRVAIYLRKSRGEEGESLARHRRTLLDMAKARGYHVMSVKEEIASGEKLAFRPKMKELLQEVESGKYEAVLCMDLDRLGRGDMKEQGIILEIFRQSGTKIITPRKEYDLSDEIDEELSELQAFFARKEFKIITRRLQAGRRASIMEGNWIFGNAPYGYRITRDEKGPTLEPHPEEAPVVRQIFAWYTDADRPIGAARIANKLNEMGIPSRTGKQWTRYVVLKMLQKAPVYAGRIFIDRQKCKKVAGGRRRQLTGNLETVPGRHPAIISEETARRVMEQIEKRMLPHAHRPLQNPLAGLIRCADCGRVMRRQEKFGRFYLRCEFCPGNLSAPLADIEAELIAELRSWLDKYRVTIRPEKEEAPDILPSLRKQKAAAEQQKNRLHDLLEQGVYDIDTFVQRSKVLTERIEKLEAAIQEAERQQEAADITPRVEKILDDYEDATPEQKNRLLKLILDKAIYEKRQWGGPFRLEVHPRL